MRDAGQAPGRPITEILDGPLWMVADSRRVRREGNRILAYSGYVSSGSAPAADVPPFVDEPWRDISSGWDGHYVLAQARLDLPSLWLFRAYPGDEALYYASCGDLFLFSNSVKPLLAHPGVRRSLDEESAAEFILSDYPAIVFGNNTLWRGVQELLGGQWLLLSRDGLTRRSAANPMCSELRENADHDPQRLRRCLSTAIGSAIGRDRQVAVLLSGGIDSSAIASFAVQQLGPRNVHAFTYDFEETSHASEAEYAAQVANGLGISHRVIKISFEQYFEAVPELIWRTESPGMRAAAWLLTLREIARSGVGKVLTGMGMEHLLGIHQHGPFVGRFLPRWNEAADLDAVLKDCAKSHFPSPNSASTEMISSIPRELYYLLLCLWRHGGRIADVSGYYPDDLRALVHETSESSRVKEAIAPLKEMHFNQRVWQAILDYYTGYRAGRGKFKAWAELGVQVLSPALFSSCIAEIPYFGWQSFHSARTYRQSALTDFALTDFRWLLIEGLRGHLPDPVLFRQKIVTQSPLPSAWPQFILDRLRSLPERAIALSPRFGEGRASLTTHFSKALAHLALFHRFFIESKPGQHPPTWEELGIHLGTDKKCGMKD